MEQILSAVAPSVTEIIVMALSGLLSMLLITVRSWVVQRIGSENTAALIDVLHRAIDTGVKSALSNERIPAPGGSAQTVIIEKAISHAKASIPETIQRLKPSIDVLRSIAQAKLQEIRGGK